MPISKKYKRGNDMKISEVVVGETYACKVSGRVVPVEVLTINMHRPIAYRFTVRNQTTNRIINVSAAKLRHKMKKKEYKL